MYNEYMNISSATKYVIRNLSNRGMSDNVYSSMPKTVLDDCIVVESQRASYDITMGYFFFHVKLFCVNKGRYKVEDTEKLERMEAILQTIVNSNCIEQHYSMSFTRFWGGAYKLQDVDMNISGRLYEIKVTVN